MRLGFLDFLDFWLFLEGFVFWLFPDKEFSLENIGEPRFNDKNKRFFIDAIERQGDGKGNETEREGNTEKSRQDPIENVRAACAACEIDELSKREWSENLVFDVDELRNAKLHMNSIAGEKHDTN